MAGFRDRLRDAYDEATSIGRDVGEGVADVGKDVAGRAYDLYTDDRIREIEELSVLRHLSTSERYETMARHDADVLRVFEEESRDIYTVEELDALYDAAHDELELTGSTLLPDRDELEDNAPRTAAKFALRRALKLPAGAGVALDIEYEFANTLRRARRLEEEGEELEAELMRAAVEDKIPRLADIPGLNQIPGVDKLPDVDTLADIDPELSPDRLDDRYAERREAIEERDGHPVLDKLRDAFHH